METKNIEISGFKFNLSPIPGRKALKLDKKVVSLILPAFRAFESLDKEIDFGKIVDALSASLDSLKDDEFESFVADMLSTTGLTEIPEKAISPEIMTGEVIDRYFQKNIFVIYKLLWEVMKFNNFSPFELVGAGGLGALGIDISSFLTPAKKSSGKKSEKSDN